MMEKVKSNQAQAKWTFLVYMAGDNNLDGAALRDIAEMAKAGSTKDVHILVQLDRIEDQKTRRFRITPGGGFKKDCIETFSETNTGDPQILYSFCKWAVDNYPADRYALILWNHGSGWWEEARGRVPGPAQEAYPLRSSLAGVPAGSSPAVGASLTGTGSAAISAPAVAAAQAPMEETVAGSAEAEASPRFGREAAAPVPLAQRRHRPLFRHAFPQAHRSICYDDTSGGDALDNRELRVVLAGICALLGRKIDLLGMDACLMNMVEVAWQLRDSVQVIVGSEIEEPFDGWPYSEILSRLAARPRQKAAAFARWIVKSYLASYKGKGETVTQSALDAGQIDDVVTKIDALSEAILAALETDAHTAPLTDPHAAPETLAAADLIVAAWKKSPRFYDDNYIDLLCFAKHLRRAADPRKAGPEKTGLVLHSKADALIAALKPGKSRAILCQGKIGPEVRGAGGLSIYFPGDRINPAYRALDFCADGRWLAFLERFLAEQRRLRRWPPRSGGTARKR